MSNADPVTSSQQSVKNQVNCEETPEEQEELNQQHQPEQPPSTNPTNETQQQQSAENNVNLLPSQSEAAASSSSIQLLESSDDLNNSFQLEKEIENQISESINDQVSDQETSQPIAINDEAQNELPIDEPQNAENEISVEETNQNNQNEQINEAANENQPNEQQNEPPNLEFEDRPILNALQNRVQNIIRFFNDLFPDMNLANMEQNEQMGDVEEDDEDEEIEEDDNDEDNEDEETIDQEEEEEDDEDERLANDEEYENAQVPDTINYDTALPSSHNYLGENFEEVNAPKTVREQNDELTIPLLPVPGSDHLWRINDSSNDIQLLPGQIMPLFFYSPIQVQLIKKRMKDKDPTIGFALTSKFFRLITQRDENQADQQQTKKDLEAKFGILAEIISARDETDSQDNNNAMMHDVDGLVLKVKGRERFKILKVRRDITGCTMADIKILPDYVLNVNPLIKSCQKNSAHFYESYLYKNETNNYENERIICSQSKAEYLNVSNSIHAWVFRRHDPSYTIGLIIKELSDTFKRKLPIKTSTRLISSSQEEQDDEDLIDYRDPLIFANWLLNNFPFDDNMRINCLKLDCINQRLIYMYSLLKSFTNINCRKCAAQLCSKSDVFSITKQGFMNPFLNPGGFVHETLTVYKLKNFRLSREPPSTQYSWFPGYAWQICSCRNCSNHIGWKFSSTKPELKPDKFWGLTRKSIYHTYNKDVEDETKQNEENQNQINSNNVSLSTQVSIESSD